MAFLLLAVFVQAPSHAALIAFYPFEGNAVDVTGNGFDGTPTGAVSVTSSGFQGQAYDFENSGYVRLSTLGIYPSNYPKLTAGAWVRVQGVPPGGSSGNTRDLIISNSNGGTNDRNIGLGVWPDSVRGWYAQNRASTYPAQSIGREAVITQGTPFPDAWTFIAATWDQDARITRLYVDRNATTIEPLLSSTRTLSIIASTGQGFTDIGKLGHASNAFNGVIDNVFFFDEVLSEAQLTAIRDGGQSALFVAPNPIPEPSCLLLAILGLSLLRRVAKIRRGL